MGLNHVKGRSYNELKSDLSLNNVENIALSTWAGSSNITTLGTISNLAITGTFTAGGDAGSSGQVLKSTGTGIEWVNEIDITTSTNYGTATTNNLTLGNSSASSQELTINALGGVTYTGHLIPSSNATYDIGSYRI